MAELLYQAVLDEIASIRQLIPDRGAKRSRQGGAGARWRNAPPLNANSSSSKFPSKQQLPQMLGTQRRQSMDDNNNRGKATVLQKNKSSVDYVDWSRTAPLPAITSSKALKHNPYASPPRRVSLAVEQKEKILSLTELNSSLAKEASSLHLDKSSLATKVNQLEDELKSISAKMIAVMTEKKELSTSVKDSTTELSSKESKIAALTQEKRLLEAEKLSLLDSKSSLESQLIDTERKLKESCKRAEEAESAVGIAVEEIESLGHKLLIRSSDAAFISDIAKKIELNGLQSCKGALRKELKRFSSMVMKAKEEVIEAKVMIEKMKGEESKQSEVKGRLEKALEMAVEKSSDLERQEKMLIGSVQTLEGRVVELEGEVRAVRREKEEAIAKARAEEYSAAQSGMSCIRECVRVLQENARRSRDEILQAEKENEGEGEEMMKSSLRVKLKEFGALSMDMSMKAEEQMVKLKAEVEGLEAAVAVARDAARMSEQEVLNAIVKMERKKKNGGGGWMMSELLENIPLSFSFTPIPYVIAAGLFAYTLYSNSNNQDF